MKKKIVLLMTTVMIGIGCLSGCGNKDMFDTVYTYKRAIIKLPTGETIEGKVQSWTDYEDGDQLQIKIDGKTYLVHSTNVVLIDK